MNSLPISHLYIGLFVFHLYVFLCSFVYIIYIVYVSVGVWFIF